MTVRASTVLCRVSSILAFASMPAWAAPPPVPDFGLRGLGRVEVVFASADPRAPSGQELSRDQECRAIPETLASAGLSVVSACAPGDGACGRLIVTVDVTVTGPDGGRAYAAGLELAQPLRLARDPDRVLSVPVTWGEHRLGVVAANHNATRAACLALRDRAVRLGALWRDANR